MMELTAEQQRAVDAGAAPRLRDPRTNKEYVLIPAEAYDSVRGLAGEEGLDMRQVALLVEQVMRDEDADDPTLEIYQQRYGKKPRPGAATW